MSNNKERETIMEEQIKIGKSIIKKFVDYYEAVELDDETEFLPILKVIISGIVDSLKNRSEKMKIEKQLKEFAKQLYIDLWLAQAKEDEPDIDIEFERKEAIKTFEKLYRKTQTNF